MLETVHCISLRTVKYSDSSSIVTLWTRERGRISAVVPSGSGREAQRRRAIMMPLGTFEAVAAGSAGTDIVRLRDVRSSGLSVAASADPLKSTVAIFIAEFLYTVLRDSAPDGHMSDFIFDWTAILAAAPRQRLANFPIAFIYNIGRFLGVEPDVGTYSPGAYFDMRQGRFTSTLPLGHSRVLDPDAARVVLTLARLNRRNYHLLRLNRMQRNQILDLMLEYYNMHLAPLTSITSLDILRAVLG